MIDQPLRVAVVAAIAATQDVAAELRRASMHVELATVTIFEEPPAVPVYVVIVDPPGAASLGERCVAWATASDLRPGLIGVIDHGTARDTETLLATGFDDVIATPLSTRELAARVRAVHRRVHWTGVVSGRLRYGEMTLDLYGRALWFRGKTISLTSIELAVLRELIKARGRPLSRIELLDRAWGEEELDVSERAVDNVILRLRRKLPEPELIETVRSVGFRLGQNG